MKKWICCQSGSREHYAIPRALQHAGVPFELITDLWLAPNNFISQITGKRRYHDNICNENVKSFNYKSIINQLINKQECEVDFDKQASKYLTRISKSFHGSEIFFTYSYSNPLTLQQAKNLGLRTILGQINPGPREAEIVTAEYTRYFGNKYRPTVPDSKYWEQWENEVQHADTIIVNSPWSEKLLVDHGINKAKIKIVPLAYEKPISDKGLNKVFSKEFSKTNPLKLLYLGTVSIRKGFHMLKQAMESLRNEPVVLIVLGRLHGPEELLEKLPENITYHHEVPPHKVGEIIVHSDMLVLPTFSDGFAITQLEAQAYKCPILTTPFCGNVVTDNKNGYIMKEITAENIIEKIMTVLNNPSELEKLSTNSVNMNEYSLEALSNNLNMLAH